MVDALNPGAIMDIDMQKTAGEPTPGTAVTQTLPEGMRTIELRVGPGGARTQTFIGRELAESHRVTKAGAEVVRVYQSRKGKLVVHRHYIEWTEFTNVTRRAFRDKKSEFTVARKQSDQSDLSAITHWAKGFRDWRDMLGLGEDGYGDFTVDIVDAPGELRDLVPERVFRIVADVLENPAAQVLDI
ncbi:EXLDI protein [Nocardia sp. NPDC005978]|uniref:EXLDI protein n=1 Tax=Nocardia sp. NPDC005978 TaxID=3156725 RepID=UPI0033AA0822